MLTFNDLRPLFPFIVRQEGTIVQIKPFFQYHVWLDWFDLAPLDYSTAIIDLTAAVEAAQADATAAGTAAGDAYNAAIDAQELALDAGGAAVDALNDAATAQATADAALAAAGGAAIYPTTYFINPRSMKVNSGGFGAFGQVSTDVFNGGYIMTGLGSEVEVKFPMAAGNWKFMIVGAKYSGAGKVTLYIDNNIVSEIDFYSAATLRNQEVVWNLNAVAVGLHTFHVKITDKHASGAYNLACNYMSLWKV